MRPCSWHQESQTEQGLGLGCSETAAGQQRAKVCAHVTGTPAGHGACSQEGSPDEGIWRRRGPARESGQGLPDEGASESCQDVGTQTPRGSGQSPGQRPGELSLSVGAVSAFIFRFHCLFPEAWLLISYSFLSREL